MAGANVRMAYSKNGVNELFWRTLIKKMTHLIKHTHIKRLKPACEDRNREIFNLQSLYHIDLPAPALDAIHITFHDIL